MEKLLEQLDPRSIRLLGLGLIAVLVVVISSYSILPQFKRWQSQSKSVAVLESVRLGQTDIQSQMDALRDEIDDIRRRMRGDLPEMPLQELESYIIGRFQYVSWNTDVDLLSVRPGMNTTMKRFDEISFDVEISGGYQDIYRWLWALGEALGFVVVKNFEITPQSHGEIEPRLTAKLNIVFFQPEDPE